MPGVSGGSYDNLLFMRFVPVEVRNNCQFRNGGVLRPLIPNNDVRQSRVIQDEP